MKMKFYMFLVMLSITGLLQAQTFCLDLEELQVENFSITYRIMISGSSTFGLGSSNLQFSFNEDALANPTLISTPLSEFPPYFYSSLTVTNPAEGVASFNIELAAANTFAFQVMETQQEIAQIRFEIINHALPPELSWSYNGGTTETVVFHENEINQLFVTELSCLEVSQAILPIRLTEFNISKNEQDAILSWSTSSEINFSHFELQRSQNLNHWVSIGEVVGQGNSFEENNYHYTDKNPQLILQSKDLIYYRLKSIDYDGSFEYSDVRSIKFNTINADDLSLFPNPAKNELFINMGEKSFDGLLDGLSISIKDVSGRVVCSKSIGSFEPYDTYRIDIDALKPGVYYVKVLNQYGLLSNKKIIKVE